MGGNIGSGGGVRIGKIPIGGKPIGGRPIGGKIEYAPCMMNTMG